MINLRDNYVLDGNAVRETADGFLVAVARVARTGIQIYGGSEVGKPTMDKVRVYRPEDQVFSVDSMKTFAHKPLTDNHPSVPVNSKNWRKTAVGFVGDEVARDGDFIRVPLMLADAATIAAVKNGKAELSVGYSADLKWGEGTTPAGETYDAMQTGIVVNHVAIVDTARGGPKLRIGDDGHMEKPLKMAVVDGVSVEMTDVAQQVVDRYVAKLIADAKTANDAVAKLTTDLADERSAHAKTVADGKVKTDTLDAQVATLTTQLAEANKKLADASSPSALDAAVKDRAETIGKAKVAMGDKVSTLVVDGKTTAEIRKQVVATRVGDAASGWSDDQVKTSFDTLTVGIKVDAGAAPVADAALRAVMTPGLGGTGLVVSVADVQASRDKAREDRDARRAKAWEGKAAS